MAVLRLVNVTQLVVKAAGYLTSELACKTAGGLAQQLSASDFESFRLSFRPTQSWVYILWSTTTLQYRQPKLSAWFGLQTDHVCDSRDVEYVHVTSQWNFRFGQWICKNQTFLFIYL